MTDDKPKPKKDPRVARHMRALQGAAESRDPSKLEAALADIQKDADLTPLQRGAIFKIIAQEQASTYFQIVMNRPFGAPPAPGASE